MSSPCVMSTGGSSVFGIVVGLGLGRLKRYSHVNQALNGSCLSAMPSSTLWR